MGFDSDQMQETKEAENITRKKQRKKERKKERV